MKIFVTAMALVFALPAAAQTAPAQQQHQDHQQHGQPDGHANRGDCCADRNGNGRMDCCEGMEQGDRRNCCQERAPQPAPQPQADQGH